MSKQLVTVADGKMLEILVCPLTRESLQYDVKKQVLISKGAGLAYPIRNGIPILLESEAQHIDPDT